MIGRFNTVKISVLSKLVDSVQSQYKFQDFLTEIDRLVLNSIWKCKGPSVKNHTETEMLPYFKLRRVYHSFKNWGRRHHISDSEMTNSLPLTDIPLLSV